MSVEKNSRSAPPWIVTFADLVILLMCFFVLMLSFSTMNDTTFASVSSSIRSSFKGSTSESNPAPATSTSTNDISFLPATNDALQLAPLNKSDDKTLVREIPPALLADARRLQSELREWIDRDLVDIFPTDTRILIRFDTMGTGDAVSKKLAANGMLAAMVRISELTPTLESEITITGATSALLEAARESDPERISGIDDSAIRDVERTARDRLQDPLEKRMIRIEGRGQSLLISMGTEGAFGSGDAQLTHKAKQWIRQISEVAKETDTRIVVSGHTDDVPISNSRYRDNWDLSAARAIAVVREMVRVHRIDAERVRAQGFADTKPIAPNDSRANRLLNRRIEISLETGSSTD
jgi:chemotaxis protein MotB